MRAICLLLIGLAIPLASAQEIGTTFHCVIKGVHSVDMKGKLVRNNNAGGNLKGKNITVDRHSGKITADFYNNHSPTVLWNGGGSGKTPTVYLAEDIIVAADGTAFSLFQVLRNKTKNTKPFAWHLPTVTITGMCK